jgi:hypothetical protein
VCLRLPVMVGFVWGQGGRVFVDAEFLGGVFFSAKGVVGAVCVVQCVVQCVVCVCVELPASQKQH